MTGHWLFSYGTLRQQEVQRALFGRRLVSVDDALPGFRIEPLRITDPHVIAVSGSDIHPALRPAVGLPPVTGSALLVTDEDLLKADAYEVDYIRTAVTLASGRRGYVYLARET